jgi:hypothetical protein
MKYVAVCVLSVATMLSASAAPIAPSAQTFAPSLIAPAVRAAKDVRGVVDEVAPGVSDSVLMTMLASALIALQLRRRQKSLRSPRLAILGG